MKLTSFFLKCWSSMLYARENASNIIQHEKQLKKCWMNSRFDTDTNITSWRKFHFEQNTFCSFIHLKDEFCLTFVWQTNIGQKNSPRVKPESFFSRCHVTETVFTLMKWWNNLVRTKVNNKTRKYKTGQYFSTRWILLILIRLKQFV